MRKIIIVLEITEEETVENYFDIDNDLISDDLFQGSLMEKAILVAVKKIEE